MSTEEKPKKTRKNPWHTRKVNKRFKEINQSVEKTSDVKLKTDIADGVYKQIETATRKISSLKKEYADILASNKKSNDELYDLLPIESLKDLFEIEKCGQTSKPKFSDIIKAGKIKKEGVKTIEEKDKLITLSKIAEIELLQAKIDEIINISKDKKDEV